MSSSSPFQIRPSRCRSLGRSSSSNLRGRSSSLLQMNKGAVFSDTMGPLPSKPLLSGQYNRHEDGERLRSSYSQFHGPKIVLHDRRSEISSKPSSLRLLAGTNEFAEDLTGQRLPLNAYSWKSETKANFDGKVHRPSSAPTVCRTISMMENQEPIFGKTFTRGRTEMDLQLSELNPHQSVAPSQFRGRDLYQTTYSLTHRPFARDEQIESSAHWNRERRTRPWLQEPVSRPFGPPQLLLPCRLPAAPAANQVYPNDAQLSTLPHYLDPQVKLGRSEVQEEFGNPFRAPSFYFEEPNKLQKPVSVHLQKTFVN